MWTTQPRGSNLINLLVVTMRLKTGDGNMSVKNINETSGDSPKNAKMINASLHRLENEMFSGSKN
jgi:hypothetical protein